MDGDESIQQLAGMGLPMRHNTRSNGKQPADDNNGEKFRFTKDTEEYKLLEKVMRSGAAKASDRPSDIHSRYDAFKKININSFRAQYNTLKNILGLGTKAGKSFKLSFKSVYIPLLYYRDQEDSRR